MTEREAFEAWASDNNEWPQCIERSGDSYKLMQTKLKWEAWQAARAQPAQAVPVLTSQDIWDDDHIMALNAELGLSMDQLVKLSHAIEQAVRAKMGVAVPMPPEDWSVFNTGAEVASGLTWAEAWDYMTPSRIERGWTAVCVANKSNIGIVGKEGA